MRWLPGLLANLDGHFDGIIALDDQSVDGSGDFLARQPGVLEVLRVEPGAQGELEIDRNHRRLVEAAWRHDPDWLFGIDADERVEPEFRERAEQEIDAAEARGHDALWVPWRELWDRPDQFRSDGLWGRKQKACLFRSRRDHVFDDNRVHAIWASMPVDPTWVRADLELFHLRMLTEQDRRDRHARYLRVDPDRQWQPIGYDYMLDEAGLELTAVPPHRVFRPLPADAVGGA